MESGGISELGSGRKDAVAMDVAAVFEWGKDA